MMKVKRYSSKDYQLLLDKLECCGEKNGIKDV